MINSRTSANNHGRESAERLAEKPADTELSWKFEDALSGSAEELMSEELGLEGQKKSEDIADGAGEDANKGNEATNLADVEETHHEHQQKASHILREKMADVKRDVELDHRFDKRILDKKLYAALKEQKEIKKLDEATDEIEVDTDVYSDKLTDIGDEVLSEATDRFFDQIDRQEGEGSDRLLEHLDWLAESMDEASDKEVDEIQEEAIHVDNERVELKAGADSGANNSDVKKDKSISFSEVSGLNSAEKQEQERLEESRTDLLEQSEESARELVTEDEDQDAVDLRWNQEQDEKDSSNKIDGTSIEMVNADSETFDDSNRDSDGLPADSDVGNLKLEAVSASAPQRFDEAVDGPDAPVDQLSGVWDEEPLLDNQDMLADDTENGLEDDPNQIEEEAIHVDNERVEHKAGADSGANNSDVKKDKSISFSEVSGLNSAEKQEQERLEESRTDLLEQSEESARELVTEDEDQDAVDLRWNQEQDEKDSSNKIDGTSIEMVNADSETFDDSNRDSDGLPADSDVGNLKLEAVSASAPQRFDEAVDGPDAPVDQLSGVWDEEPLLDNQDMLADDTENGLEDDPNQIEEEAIHVDNERVEHKAGADSGANNSDVKKDKSISSSEVSGLNSAEKQEQEMLEESRTDLLEQSGELEESAREFVTEDEDQDAVDLRWNHEQDEKDSSNKIDGTSIEMVNADSGTSDDSNKDSGGLPAGSDVGNLKLEAVSASAPQRFDEAVDGPDAPVDHLRVAPAFDREAVGKEVLSIFDRESVDELVAEEEAIHVDNDPVELKAGADSGANNSDVKKDKSISSSEVSGLNSAEKQEQEMLEESRTDLLEQSGELEESAREFVTEDEDQDAVDLRWNHEQDEKDSSNKIDGTSIEMVNADSGTSDDSNKDSGGLPAGSDVGNLKLEAVSASAPQRFDEAVDGPDAPVGHLRVAPAFDREAVGKEALSVFDKESVDELAAEEEVQRSTGGLLENPDLGNADLVDIDESYITTGREDDEESDDSLGAFSTRELAVGAVMSSSQGQATSDGQGQQGSGGHQRQGKGSELFSVRESSGSIFGIEESLDDDFFLGNIELEEPDADLLEIDESAWVGLPVALMSVSGPAVEQDGAIESLPQPTSVEEALEALSVRILVSVPEKGGQEQVTMFFKDLGPFESLQITLLRESGRLVVVVQGMDAQTEAAIKGESSRLLGELKKYLKSGREDNELVEVRGRSGRRNQNEEFVEWYIHDETDEDSE